MTISDENKRWLLELVHRTIETRLGGEGCMDSPPPRELFAKCGAFVTLHKGGRLRGCIGRLKSDEPLYKTITDMAISAGFEDPRFPPLSKEELAEVDIEISVLSPLELVQDTKDPKAIIIGTHGIYITKDLSSGVLLPQVAVEHGFDSITFLEQTCLKAGLAPGSWREEGASVYVFTAEIFSDRDLKP